MITYNNITKISRTANMGLRTNVVIMIIIGIVYGRSAIYIWKADDKIYPI